jgi:hypothetical protein
MKAKKNEEYFDKIELVFISIFLTSLVWAISCVIIADHVQNSYYSEGYNQGYVNAQTMNIQSLKDAWQEGVGIDYFNLNKEYEISCDSISYRRYK